MIMGCPLWSQWATCSIDCRVLTLAESMLDSLEVIFAGYFSEVIFSRRDCLGPRFTRATPPRVNPVGTNANTQKLAAMSGGAARQKAQNRLRIGGRLLDIGNMRRVE